jgi:hypothetical protein
MRSESFHRQNGQHLAEYACKRELYACSFPSRLSKFDCSAQMVASLLRFPGLGATPRKISCAIPYTHDVK